VLTGNGRVEVNRTRWHAPGAGGDSPVDRLLDVAESAVSVGVRELCCREGTDSRSFARAAENLGKSAQLQLSEEMLRQIVESEGKVVLSAAGNEQLEINWSASDCKTTTPQGQEVSRIYASGDGVLVPVTTQTEKLKRRATALKKRREKRAKRGQRRPRLPAVKRGADRRYKQFNVVSFYDHEQDHRLVLVTRKDHRESRKLLRRGASQLRIGAADESVGLIDGAPTLQKQFQSMKLTGLGLDFYHFGQHVHEGARQTFGEESELAKAWAADVLHTAKHEEYGPLWDKLCTWRSGQRSKARRNAAADLQHFVAERRPIINYRQFQERGWHIGSGPIESMCKVTTQRVKGSGMRWDRDNAEAMMALEAMRQSNQWDSYWAKAVCSSR
jgi:hypothetical protein